MSHQLISSPEFPLDPDKGEGGLSVKVGLIKNVERPPPLVILANMSVPDRLTTNLCRLRTVKTQYLLYGCLGVINRENIFQDDLEQKIVFLAPAFCQSS